MTQSTLSLFNTAISLARGKGRLTTLTPSSPNRELEECQLWADLVLDTVQSAAFWESGRSTASLSLLSSRDASAAWADGDPEYDLLYSYALPSGCLRPRFLSTYEPFTISFRADLNRQVLNTNQTTAVLTYSVRNDNPAHWSPSQFLATSHGLAAYIVGPLTGQTQLQDYHFTLANRRLLEAQSQIANGESFQIESVPPALAARGYTDDLARRRFYYPFGALFGNV